MSKKSRSSDREADLQFAIPLAQREIHEMAGAFLILEWCISKKYAPYIKGADTMQYGHGGDSRRASPLRGPRASSSHSCPAAGAYRRA